MKQSNAAQHANEFHQSRAKEYRERYEGMRNLEWQTLVQTYAGYAAIAVAFHKASERFIDCHSAWPVRSVAMTATLIFFAAMCYLHYRIEERLITFDETYEFYVKKLHGQGEDPDPGPGTRNLGHQFFWTYDTQMILSTFTALGILAYERFSPVPVACNARWSPWLIVTMTALSLGFLGAIAIWVCGRMRLRGLLSDLRPARKAKDGCGQ